MSEQHVHAEPQTVPIQAGGANVAPKLVNWASVIDKQTFEQAKMAATMPFIYPHLALMPDAHLGKGATVGSVIPTKGAIMPAAVGVDIGCGMIAVRTQFDTQDINGLDRKALRQAIERAVPLSAGNYNKEVTATAAPRIAELERMAAEAGFDIEAFQRTDPRFKPEKDWRLQLGSLGSGNHFIEVSIDEESRVWLFLHSGSRGIGNRIAVHHIGIAQEYCKRIGVALPTPEKKHEHDVPRQERDLAFLEEGTPEFDAYIRELRWAQHFALLNREEMMDRVQACFEDWVHEPVVRETVVNCHHNYTEQETHFGETVWLSRKGAIDAHEGVLGLIPGSMGDKSYVVIGKGNRDALCSSPHGAGRQHGRKQAERLFKVDQLRERMVGIEWNEAKAATFLDEIPMAYKPIDQVMEDAKDLVAIMHTLRQIVNVKGD